MFGRHPKEFVGVRRSCCVFEQHSCVTAFREPAPRSFYESACNPTVVLVAALSVPALGKFERSPFADPSFDASLIDGFDSDGVPFGLGIASPSATTLPFLSARWTGLDWPSKPPSDRRPKHEG